MGIELRWARESDLDRVAEARLRCYAHASKQLEDYQRLLRNDRRAAVGDYLMAEEDGQAIGTTTSLSMTMSVRGGAVPCQGVAWVGTIRTHRRTARRSAQNAGLAADSAGVATRLMAETLRRGRERGQVVSALMPFRASFYEHFGYGLVERRCAWTVPLALLPDVAADGTRFFESADLDEVAACRRRFVARGQCDIEHRSMFGRTTWTG